MGAALDKAENAEEEARAKAETAQKAYDEAKAASDKAQTALKKAGGEFTAAIAAADFERRRCQN